MRRLLNSPILAVEAKDKPDIWKSLRKPECKLCPLHETAQFVCLIGKGNLEADVVLVGEAPGFREDDSGKPFVGRSGQLLEDVLNELGHSRSTVYITNTVHCRPPDNREPKPAEIKKCLPYLERELNLVKPKVIIAFGNVAIKGLLNKTGITRFRGNVFDYAGRGFTAKVIPTFHPASILRNPGNLGFFVSDMEKAFSLADGEYTVSQSKWSLLDTEEKVNKAIKKIIKAGVVAFDVETEGLQYWNPQQRLCTLGLSWKEGTGASIPIFHKNSPFSKQEVKRILSKLDRKVFSNPKVVKVAHNFKFDWHWLRRYGVGLNMRGYKFDTMLAHYALNENVPHGLDSLSMEYTDYGEYWRETEEQLSKGKAWEIPIESLAKYNAIDCDVTLIAYNKLRLKLDMEPRIKRVFNLILMNAVTVLMKAEEHGMQVDTKFLKQLKRKFKDEIARLLSELKSYKQVKSFDKYMAGKKGKKWEGVNFNSPEQVSAILFSQFDKKGNQVTGYKGFNLEPIELTESGNASSKEEVLIELSRIKKVGVFAVTLITYKKVMKLYSSYVDGIKKHIGPDGRVHPSFKIHGTKTGRLSCEKPNLQQIPRSEVAEYDTPLKTEIKIMFNAPPGYKLVQLDYSQAELRIMAHIADEKNMKKWFRDGHDVHLYVAAKMLGITPEELMKKPDCKAHRKRAKTVNFGTIYCVGPNKLAQSLSSPKENIYYTPKQAERFLVDYFELFPAIEKTMARMKRMADKQKYVETLFGRKRRLPDVDSPERGVREEALRQAVNSPIQGTVGDYATFSVIYMHGLLDKSVKIPDGVQFVNTVHDSLLFYVPEDKVMEFGKWAKNICENLPTKKYFGFTSSVPMLVDYESGDNWGKMAKIAA